MHIIFLMADLTPILTYFEYFNHKNSVHIFDPGSGYS